MFAIRDDRYVIPRWGASLIDHDFTSEYIVQEDLTKAARKVSDAKKHESTYFQSLSFSTL